MKFRLDSASVDSLLSLSTKTEAKIWLDYVSIYTASGSRLARFEETNLHFTEASYSRTTNVLLLTYAKLLKITVNGNTHSFDNRTNSLRIEIDAGGAWVSVDEKRSRFERKEKEEVRIECESGDAKGRIILW